MDFVMLRGLGRGKVHWAGFDERVQAAFPRVNVIALDALGNGLRNQEVSPRNIFETLIDLKSQFRPSKDGIVLFGLSLGGMIALDWMKKFPREVKQAFILNSSVGRGTSPLERLRPHAMIQLPLARSKKDAESVERAVLQFNSHLAHENEGVIQLFSNHQERYPVNAKNLMNQIFSAVRYRGPKELNHPVHFLVGEKDRMVHPNCSYKMAQIWDRPLYKNPTAGHELTLDDPDWVLEILKRHLVNKKAPALASPLIATAEGLG